MLDGYEYRLAYCAAFGSLTSDLSRLLLSPFDLFTPWSTIFYAHYDIISKYPVLRREYSIYIEITMALKVCLQRGFTSLL